MKSVISDNKIIPFLPCYKRTSQLHETKVSDLKTVYGCNGYAVYDYIENEIFRTGNHSLYWCKNMLCRVADYWHSLRKKWRKSWSIVFRLTCSMLSCIPSIIFLHPQKSGNSIIMPVSSWLSIHNH